MSKKLLLSIVSVLIIVAGVAAVLVSKNDNQDSNVSTDTTSEQEQQTEFVQTFDQDGNPSLQLVDLQGQDFSVTMTGTLEGTQADATILYNANGDVKLSVSVDGETVESYITGDNYITCTADQGCFGLPNSSDLGFDPTDFIINQTDVETSPSGVTYVGQQDCRAGSCNVYSYVDGATNTMLYVDVATGRVSQLTGKDDKTDLTLYYDYSEVNFTVPTDYQDLSSFTQ